eukprot:1452364-Amphidinium_carterae.2
MTQVLVACTQLLKARDVVLVSWQSAESEKLAARKYLTHEILLSVALPNHLAASFSVIQKNVLLVNLQAGCFFD